MEYLTIEPTRIPKLDNNKEPTSLENQLGYDVFPCPNHFEIREKYSEKDEIEGGVFRTTAEDNSVSMSQEDLLGLGAGQLHVLHFLTRQAIYAKRRLIYSELCVQPLRACIPRPPGRQAAPSTTCVHGKTKKQRQPSRLG